MLVLKVTSLEKAKTFLAGRNMLGDVSKHWIPFLAYRAKKAPIQNLRDHTGAEILFRPQSAFEYWQVTF